MTTVLDAISDKIAQGKALGESDALALWESKDLVSLGLLADSTRRRRHGDAATFVRVAVVPVDQAATATVPAGAGEVRVVGDADALDGHIAAIAALVLRADRVPVTAGVLDELEARAGDSRSLNRLLRALAAAGIHGIAEARIDRLATPVETVRAVLAAHLAVARFTVFSLPESQPWTMIDRVARLHANTDAVRTFAPLPRRQVPGAPTTGYADVKLVALARLLLDRVPSVQVDWSLCGPKLAQVALLFGADDLDGVSPAEDDGTGRRRAPREEVRRNIRAASLTPVERDARFCALEG